MHVAAWVLGLCLTAQTPSNAHLAQAEQLVGSLHYSDAAKALAKARSDPGNDRPTLLRILELTAVVEASVGRRDTATDAFRQLLSVAPDYKLGDEWGPKVRTPYYEAKGWVGDHGSMTFTAQPAQTAPGKVLQVGVLIGQDALKLGQSVRFHFSGRENPSEVPLTGGVAVSPAPPQGSVSWWAELLGSHGEALEQVGTAEAPLVASAPPGPAAPLAEPAPVAEPSKTANAEGPRAPPETPSVSSPSSQPTLRPLAYGLAAGGAVALGVGAVFGVMQHGDQSQLNSASRDAQGRVTGITQKAAFALQSSANADGLLADVLLASGAVAVAAGVGIWFWGSPSAAGQGPPSASTLAATVAPGRVVLSGTFP